MFNLHRFANPARFARLSSSLLPWTGGATLLLIGCGLYLGLTSGFEELHQKDSVRILYVHVPAAWMSLFIYICMAGASVVGLVWRHPLAHMAAKSCASIGANFTFIALLTGSLWGRAMWGAWWVWDARVTSVLILFFLYLGYMALHQAFDDSDKGNRAAAILALVGVINVPIIHFSVEWWYTLHQPTSVFRLDGPTIHSSMLWPLLVVATGFTLYFVTLLLWNMRAEIMARRLHILQLRQAQT